MSYSGGGKCISCCGSHQILWWQIQICSPENDKYYVLAHQASFAEVVSDKGGVPLLDRLQLYQRHPDSLSLRWLQLWFLSENISGKNAFLRGIRPEIDIIDFLVILVTNLEPHTCICRVMFFSLEYSHIHSYHYFIFTTLRFIQPSCGHCSGFFSHQNIQTHTYCQHQLEPRLYSEYECTIAHLSKKRSFSELFIGQCQPQLWLSLLISRRHQSRQLRSSTWLPCIPESTVDPELYLDASCV